LLNSNATKSSEILVVDSTHIIWIYYAFLVTKISFAEFKFDF